MTSDNPKFTAETAIINGEIIGPHEVVFENIYANTGRFYSMEVAIFHNGVRAFDIGLGNFRHDLVDQGTYIKLDYTEPYLTDAICYTATITVDFIQSSA